MKKFLFVVLIILTAVSLSFAGERKVSSIVKATDFNDLSIERAHMCSADSLNCDVPEKLTTGSPVVSLTFFAPVSQFYTQHYLVSDPAGTVIFYQPFTDFVNAGAFFIRDVPLEPPLFPAGDFVFTAVVVGDDGRIAVSDQYRFSVR